MRYAALRKLKLSGSAIVVVCGASCASATIRPSSNNGVVAIAGDNNNHPSIRVKRDEKATARTLTGPVYPGEDSTITRGGEIYIDDNKLNANGELKSLHIELEGKVLFDQPCQAACGFRSASGYVIRMADIGVFPHHRLLAVAATNTDGEVVQTYYHTKRPHGWQPGVGSPILFRLRGSGGWYKTENLAPSLSTTYRWYASGGDGYTGLGPILTVFSRKDEGDFSPALGLALDRSGHFQAAWTYHFGENRAVFAFGVRPEIFQTLFGAPPST